jgi:uncharacterized membrane protein
MLDWPYIHLTINHFPVVLSVLGLGAAVIALIIGRRSAWVYSMVTLLLGGLIVYPVRFTGDEADDALHDPWYIKHGVIDAHDNASLYAMIFMILAGAISAYGLWRVWKRPQETTIPGWIRASILVTSLAGFGAVAYTAYLGGKIIHEAPVMSLKQAPANLPPGIATPPEPEGK